MGKPKAKNAAKGDDPGWIGDRTLVQDALEHLDSALSVFDADFKLALYNRRFIEFLDLPEDLVEIGRPFEDFIRYNAERGEYGPGDVEELARERVALAEKREAHQFDRVREDGTVIEVRGNPLPGGGFVTTYTDITERKRVEQAVVPRVQPLGKGLVESRPFPVEDRVPGGIAVAALVERGLAKHALELESEAFGRLA